MDLAPCVQLLTVSGHELIGESLVRIIYLDEAGTSSQEPVRIVAAVIVDSARQWRVVQRAIRQTIIKHVPKDRLESFTFHATKIFSGGDTDIGWSLLDRRCFLEEFISIPRRFKLPIAIGICRQNADAFNHQREVSPTELTQTQMEHAIAFLGCLSAADRWLRLNTPEDEVAMAVAEDVNGMRSILGKVKWALVGGMGFHVDPEEFASTSPNAGPEMLENGFDFKIEKIVDDVHFTPKTGSIMLQLADAVAFAVRRALSSPKHGDELSRALLGYPLPVAQYSGDFASGTFDFE
jgi:Protein of unknown function (DUF3800)